MVSSRADRHPPGSEGDALEARLKSRVRHELPTPSAYWVAYSGGLDSSVLLQLLARLRGDLAAPVGAVHVDHGLHAASGGWAAHCRAVCDELDLPFRLLRVDARPGKGESPEAVARERRYAAIGSALGPGAMLLTAHHLDDQAETLLLQLMRGAGAAGLAGMPLWRPWEDRWQARPLLDVRREALRAWAGHQGLGWIEDPSNAQCDADRNYLRHVVLPDLLARWPGAVDNIARSATHCADAAELTALQAERDLARCRGQGSGRLRLDCLRPLSPARQRALLRHWIAACDAPPLPFGQLVEARHQLLDARSDAAVLIAWQGCQLRRFRDTVWLLRQPPTHPARSPIEWNGETRHLGPGLGRVRRVKGPGGIDPDRWDRGHVDLVYRTSGLRCRPAGRGGSRTFKAIAQENNIPPWQRPCLPIVRIDGEIAAIANCCVCEGFEAGPGELGWRIDWVPDPS